MHFEIENKFRCDDLEQVRRRLRELGAEGGETATQRDGYYNHPARDFARTDEALRLRQAGAQNFLTYKGPKIDAATKSRYEEETRLADGDAALHSCDEIIRHLGFQPVALVEKVRQTFRLVHGDQQAEVALDDVRSVGTFVEIEIYVEFTHDQRRIDAAKDALQAIAGALDLKDSERRSYLELLLAGRG